MQLKLETQNSSCAVAGRAPTHTTQQKSSSLNSTSACRFKSHRHPRGSQQEELHICGRSLRLLCWCNLTQPSSARGQ
eukprot:3151525-Amphidinium_carterae.1